MRIGEYHSTWWKAIDILKQDGHLLFGGQEIWEGIREEDIEVVYERLMSPSGNLSKMSLFFTTIQIRLVKDMVHNDIALFQEIWEQTYEEQREVSTLELRRYLRHCEDINMGWINVRWGLP
jgi:hypothetical protein